ncbi:MAG TPA: UbiD family decarboxylase [Burkholderiales bacterium]
MQRDARKATNTAPQASRRGPGRARAPKSLASYLDLIRGDPAEFRTVSRTVNPLNFDVTGLLGVLNQRREYPTVQFNKPLDLHGKPSKFPLVTNLWATRERCAEAIGLARSEAGARLGSLLCERIDRKLKPVVVGSKAAPVQENVLTGKKADLFIFPAVRHFEMDLGAVLTMGMIAKPPGEDFYNITFVKAFPEAAQRAGLTVHTLHMSRILREFEGRKARCPVAYVLGHHPAFWLGTLNNTPWGDNEYATCGGFLQEPVRLAPSVTWGKDFLVPADAEIVIEGEIDPGERTVVNPFGDITTQYQAQQLGPVMEVKAITYRNGALFQDVFSGHREHMLLGSIPREGTIFNHLRNKLGNVLGVHMPYSGCARYTAYVSIRKTEEGQAKTAGLQALAHVPNLYAVVVVDQDIDPFDEEQVLWAVNFQVESRRDITIIENMRAPNDPRALGSARVIIDATRPTHIAFPTRLKVPQPAMDRVKLGEWLDPVKGGAR